jgi:hypothetical protein
VNSSTTAGRGCASAAEVQPSDAQTRSMPAIQCRDIDAPTEVPSRDDVTQ